MMRLTEVTEPGRVDDRQLAALRALLWKFDRSPSETSYASWWQVYDAEAAAVVARAIGVDGMLPSFSVRVRHYVDRESAVNAELGAVAVFSGSARTWPGVSPVVLASALRDVLERRGA